MMIYLNEKELDKNEWIGGISGDLSTFRGEVLDDLAMIENDINVILLNENIISEDNKLTIGPKIRLLIDFIKKEMIVENIMNEYPNIFIKLNELNKIRIFVAHGVSFINAKKGEPTVLIITNRGASEGLVFDGNLPKKYKNLYQFCHGFILQLQCELGYYNDELEEFENQK